ncbi:hypothetical protein BH10BAC6_BH10BAC6_09510 [soil metagenome]
MLQLLLVLLFVHSACFGFSDPDTVHVDSSTVQQRGRADRNVTSPTFSIYSETGGAGLSLWSIHGELTAFRFKHNPSAMGIHHSLRLSIGCSVDGSFLPVAAKYILLESTHHIETGLGVTFPLKARGGQDGFPEHSAVGVFILGYRFEPQDGGLLLRVNISPFIDLSTGNTTLFFGGFSIGVSL